MPEVRLFVGGNSWAAWTEISITLGIEQIAGNFEVGLSDRWPGKRLAIAIKPGEPCRVQIDDVPVIQGHIDDVVPGFDAQGHSITIRGRDATGDLVDCSAVYKGGQFKGQSLKQIADKLCQPFGIKVTDKTGANAPFKSFSIQEGETVFETLERAARIRGVLLISDGLGNLLITRASNSAPIATLREGHEILSASGPISHRDRFSSYTCKGSSQGDDNLFGDQAASPSATVSDKAIVRHRPLVIIAEDQVSIGTCKQRAIWQRNVNLGRGTRPVIRVQGWHHGKSFWKPNTIVRVTSESLGLNTNLLIPRVTFSLDENGTTTELSLARREAYDLLELPEPKEDAVWAA